MSRLIDADALLTERKKSKYYHLPNGDIAIPIIDVEHAPTVKPKPQWIPCSKRLPSENGKYIVTEKRYAVDDRNHDGKYTVIVEEVDWGDGKWRRAKFYEVTAWMPLPTPYRGNM